MELKQLADQVWIYPFAPALQEQQPNVGVIITRSETVLIDSGSGPAHARQIRAALKAQRAPRVRYVIYTHFHYDHTFGAQVWADSQIIAHEDCRRLLKERYAPLIESDLSFDEHSRQDPSRAPLFAGMKAAIGPRADFELRLPEIVFSQDLSLSLDGLTLRLQHVGGHHAADSITVLVEEARVMFLGDCYYPGPDYPEHDRALVETLLAQPAATYVEGHDKPLKQRSFARRAMPG